MPTSSIGLGPQELSLAFPFHFAFDGESRIVQVGSVLQRLLPDIRPGAYFQDHFRIERPSVEPTFDTIRKRSHEFFMLESRASKALVLRGQMLPLEGRRAMVFLGSPWLTEVAELKNLGLTIRDFALHDPISDFLFLLRAQNASLADASTLANELAAINKELEERVEERATDLRLANRGLEREISERERVEETLLASEHALQKRVADLEEAQLKLEMQGESLTRLADDLLIARDEARAADRAKSEFLAAMSHELRTPLNAIIGFSEIIKDETFGPVGSIQYRDYGSDIHESGQHLLGLINDILDLSKIESGTDELHEDKIEIPEIIRSALMLVGHRADQGGVKLELELADQLPALRADERKLKQILVNLLSNAVKFTDAGGEVALWAWCRMGSGYVFQIVDTGIGIAPEDIPKALSRFGQVDGDLNRQYEGTGLGLPLTKALVEQHGGVLDLQSQVGVGTTVTVRFPAERIVASLDHADSLDVEDRAAS